MQISSCLLFFNNTKARKIVRTAGKVFFFFSPIVCDGVEGLSGKEQLNREALTRNYKAPLNRAILFNTQFENEKKKTVKKTRLMRHLLYLWV